VYPVAGKERIKRFVDALADGVLDKSTFEERKRTGSRLSIVKHVVELYRGSARAANSPEALKVAVTFARELGGQSMNRWPSPTTV
jgi:hypothetical protein